MRVNSRAFASSLGTTLPGAAFVVDEGEARAILAAPPPPSLAEAWRVKRNFGLTGRGQRIVVPSRLAEQDLAFVRAGLAEGGVQIEPNVSIVAEFAIHGLVGPDGAFMLGPVVRQRCDARGAWASSERIAPEAAPAELAAEAARVAGAMTSARYFGPFGVDAYTYRVRLEADSGDAAGAVLLQPRSEINARYTMGFGLAGAQSRAREQSSVEPDKALPAARRERGAGRESPSCDPSLQAERVVLRCRTSRTLGYSSSRALSSRGAWRCPTSLRWRAPAAPDPSSPRGAWRCRGSDVKIAVSPRTGCPLCSPGCRCPYR